MHLNLPILDQVSDCKNLLIAGMGGGFDVFCGLPIYFELVERGQQVHLANYSFSDITRVKGGIPLTDTLVGVNAEVGGRHVYFPELYLSQWFREKRGEEITIWSMHKTGVVPLIENYRVLIEHLSIDGIVLIDGGVDGLMRGDEEQCGTLLEDSVSLLAVSELEHIPVRILAGVAFGAEQHMAYAHTLNNIADLTMEDAFLGSCSLVKRMEAYQLYEDAVLYVQDKPYQDSSVINSSIISAVRGHFGNHHLTEKTHGSRLWISPLMPIYWFFELAPVAEKNLILSQIRWSTDFLSAIRGAHFANMAIPRRKPLRIPL